ncbi:endonuclease, partial [Myxococcota bacterium]|nr:endonuclease [Myxococcota bacterium]
MSAMACDASTSSTSTDDGDDTEEHIVPIPDTYEGVWPPVYFVALGLADEGLAADHGDYWIDLKIANPQGLKALGSWTLSASNRSYLNVQLTSSEITYDFQVGDILRVHGEDFEGESDRVKSDNNPDIWDIVSTDTYGPLIEQGMFLLETPVGSTTDQTLDTTETAETTEEVDEQEVKIIDAVVYDTAENNDLWFINASFDKIKEVVAQGQWPTRNRGDAIFFENLNDTWAELYNANSPGNGTGDWQVAFTTVEEYYAPAIGLTGEALRAALHDIIDDHNVVIYDVLTAAFIFTDADPEIPGNAIQFYTGKSTATAISREHVWAKSHGGFDSSRYPAYSDLHHMRPSKTSVNGDRWHLDFGEGGALVEDTDDCYIVENLSFEPRDEVKGDVARSLFYMAVRYN